MREAKTAGWMGESGKICLTDQSRVFRIRSRCNQDTSRGGALAGVHINIFRIEHLSEIQEADYFTLSAPTEGLYFFTGSFGAADKRCDQSAFQTTLTTPPVFRNLLHVWKWCQNKKGLIRVGLKVQGKVSKTKSSLRKKELFFV